jgi:uncharacterized surface protein with fasciclin (FAS1) repeats
MNTRIGLALSALALALAGCATQPASIPESAAANAQLTTFSRLVKQAGLDETLKGAGPYTVFAPSDEAFKAVPQKTLDGLSSDKAALTALLQNHVVAGKTASVDVTNGNVKTVSGNTLALSRSGTFVTVEDAVVTAPDVPAANGVVHVIDRVLMPPKK